MSYRLLNISFSCLIRVTKGGGERGIEEVNPKNNPIKQIKAEVHFHVHLDFLIKSISLNIKEKKKEK